MANIAFDIGSILANSSDGTTISKSTVDILNSLFGKNHKVYYLGDRSQLNLSSNGSDNVLAVVHWLKQNDIIYDGVVSLPNKKGYDYWLKQWEIDRLYDSSEGSVEEFCKSV